MALVQLGSLGRGRIRDRAPRRDLRPVRRRRERGEPAHLRGSHTVGASGALCGLLGLLLVHGGRIGGAYGQRLKSVMMQNVVLMIGMSLLPRIDWMNHLGGFAMGCAMGFIAPSGPFRNRGTEIDLADPRLARAWGWFSASLYAMATRGMGDVELLVRSSARRLIYPLCPCGTPSEGSSRPQRRPPCRTTIPSTSRSVSSTRRRRS